ncbi:cation transporter [Methanorbis furvi]|uniref:HMA domain-containing protein n=1 Tax=Methanorbis furvi TaxID=3028299 RepID=A0AAE4SAG6_9EURY|nr:hypothetical protein [Methanocorpusculaceae archaeon Ag1]
MKKTFRMENLECAHCAALMETGIRKIDGVSEASISFMTEKLIIDAEENRFDEIMTEVRNICKKIEPDCRIR